jgi:molybdenum cofactor biosynthesis enzyme
MTLKLLTRVKGPEVETGIGARKICATKKTPELLGFRPVLSVTSVPLEVKLSAEVHKTDPGLSAAL